MKGLFDHQILSFWNYEKPIWKNTVHMHFMLEHILEQISFFYCVHAMQDWTATTRHGVTRKEMQQD